MPIGEPSQRPEPKSACRPAARPIERISVAEFAATGSLSTRRFQAFERGKTGHRDAVGSRSAAAEPETVATRRPAAATRTARMRVVSALLPLRLEPRLVGALALLITLQRLGRIHVAERRMIRDEFLRRPDTEPLREHGRERPHLHLSEPRQSLDPAPQFAGVAHIVPEPLRLSAVLLLDVRG